MKHTHIITILTIVFMVISFLFVIQPSIKNDENIKITSGINEFVSSTSLKIETNTTETKNATECIRSIRCTEIKRSMD